MFSLFRRLLGAEKPARRHARPRLTAKDFAQPEPLIRERRRLTSPTEYRLPEHDTVVLVRVPGGEVRDTLTLPKVAADPEPLSWGRDLLTGKPRLFGNKYLAVLAGVGDAMTIRGVVGSYGAA